MIKYVILHMGYVESACISPLILEAREDFNSPQEALENLAKGFFEKYLTDFNLRDKKKKECCKKTLKFENKAKYCLECGWSISHNVIDFEQFKYVLYEYPAKNADSMGEEIHSWNLWFNVKNLIGLDKSEVVEVFEKAEDVLLSLLKLEDPAQQMDLKKYLERQYPIESINKYIVKD